MVWASCEGETAADEENLGGVSYTPWHGFPGFYYPYLNQMHYLSPIIWLQFRNITPGVIIQIRLAKAVMNSRLRPYLAPKDLDWIKGNTSLVLCSLFILY